MSSLTPGPASRHWGPFLFDPAQGKTVRTPTGVGPGWWAGAPSACSDPATGAIYLYYRYRKPRELGRGVECRLAKSSDGVHFTDVWAATKADLDTESLEKSGLIWHAGQWRLYLSFVGKDGRWRIEQVVADNPEGFDVRQRLPVLDADDCAAEGVKDPAIYVVGGLLYMLLSYAPRPGVAITAQDMHATGDVYNTGLVKSHTGLATSLDGELWRWQGDILSPPEIGWDSYCTRLGSMIWQPPFWLGYYDGSSAVTENYEEKAGLCCSMDLRRWERLTTAAPWILSPHASGSIRYVEVLPLPGGWRYYYEYARPDGSHELRTSWVDGP